MSTNPLDNDDILAVEYLSGTDEFRQKVAAAIAEMPHSPRAWIFSWACTAIIVALFTAIVWYAYDLEETYGMRLNWEIIALLGLAGVSGIFKVWATYYWSRPRVYHMLQRFALRHPDSPHIRRLRDRTGAIDWSKVTTLTPKSRRD